MKTFGTFTLAALATALEIDGLAQTSSIHQSAGGDGVNVTWHNIGSTPAQMIWHHYNGDEWNYTLLNAGASSG